MAMKKNGTEWIQEFVSSLNSGDCIACGRCYKACPTNVMTLKCEEDDEGEEHNFMVLVNDGECIGCKVCAKVCPKGCFSHAA